MNKRPETLGRRGVVAKADEILDAYPDTTDYNILFCALLDCCVSTVHPGRKYSKFDYYTDMDAILWLKTVTDNRILTVCKQAIKRKIKLLTG